MAALFKKNVTPPSSILTNDRNRASALAWGTLGVLVAVQLGILFWLVAIKEPQAPATAGSQTPPLPGVPVPAAQEAIPAPASAPVAATPRRPVPEPGQIRAPEPEPVAPAPPAVKPTVSSTAPPPVGSFGTANSPAAPAPAADRPALPGGGMKAPAIPNFSDVPAAPTGAAAPATPAPPPALPGSGAAMPKDLPPEALASVTQIAPGLSEKPALPGSGTVAPPPMPGTLTTAEARRDLNGLLASAKELRGLGNTQDALNLLQQADLVAPSNPAVMAEMAEVYEQMGLNQKAIDQWRGIQLQGASKAGQFYDLALRRLGNVPGADAVASPALAGAPVADSEKRLRLGACQIVRDFAVRDGERYVLRVPINRSGNKSIDPNAIDLKAFFCHRQGDAVKLDNTTELTETWQTAPVDWNTSDMEIVDVIYTLPAPTAAETQQRQQKSYHGYMLHLYYDNKLQDVAAEPRELLNEAQLPTNSAPTLPANSPNPLLPPATR